jgi:UDP-N-acetylmuramate: L-alanyl-gamma-D-glutamyl-meso-diaminopimelate ligase
MDGGIGAFWKQPHPGRHPSGVVLQAKREPALSGAEGDLARINTVVTLVLGGAALPALRSQVFLNRGFSRRGTLITDALSKKKHIHLIGICGTAMASLAGMLKQRGFQVTGSDAAAYPPMSDFLRELDIPVAQPFDAKNLDPRPDLVVVGNAMSRGNVELEHVLDQRIPFSSLPQLLHDEFLRGKEVLVVAGTHGKTTTTSMLAWIFHSAGLDPSFLIGGIAENFGSSFHLGAGKHFILEGDEYDTAFFDKGPKFLHYFPDAIILTSVEFDHADIYKDLDAVETAFKRLVNLIPRRGRIVAFDGFAGDASESPSLDRCLAKAFCSVERYGAGPRANWKVTNLRLEPARTSWTVVHDGEPWDDLEFPLAGEYNVWNAAAAAALAASCGVPKEAIGAALKSFKSVKRRLEVKAQVNGITIIDDFAHHPTAIAGTLKALRARYPGARLWAILEPRSNTLRRRVLQSDLARSLAQADEVIVAGVFRSEAVPENERLELPALAAEIEQNGRRARLFADADGIVETISPEMRSGDVVAILSNGGFGGIYEKLPARLRELAGKQ